MTGGFNIGIRIHKVSIFESDQGNETQEKDQRKDYEKDVPNAIHSPADWYELLCRAKEGVAENETPACGPGHGADAESAIQQCYAATLLHGSRHGAWRLNFSPLVESTG